MQKVVLIIPTHLHDQTEHNFIIWHSIYILVKVILKKRKGLSSRSFNLINVDRNKCFCYCLGSTDYKRHDKLTVQWPLASFECTISLISISELLFFAEIGSRKRWGTSFSSLLRFQTRSWEAICSRCLHPGRCSCWICTFQTLAGPSDILSCIRALGPSIKPERNPEESAHCVCVCDNDDVLTR